MKLDPGGINGKSRRTPRIGCRVKAGNSEKHFKLQLSNASPQQAEPQSPGDLVPTRPNRVTYTILFNGSFSGLAYGTKDLKIN
jgi:hypothetical protein